MIVNDTTRFSLPTSPEAASRNAAVMKDALDKCRTLLGKLRTLPPEQQAQWATEARDLESRVGT